MLLANFLFKLFIVRNLLSMILIILTKAVVTYHLETTAKFIRASIF
jgi:hypothetical protein